MRVINVFWLVAALAAAVPSAASAGERATLPAKSAPAAPAVATETAGTSVADTAAGSRLDAAIADLDAGLLQKDRSRLGSLQGVGSIDQLFVNSRGGGN